MVFSGRFPKNAAVAAIVAWAPMDTADGCESAGSKGEKGIHPAFEPAAITAPAKRARQETLGE